MEKELNRVRVSSGRLSGQRAWFPCEATPSSDPRPFAECRSGEARPRLGDIAAMLSRSRRLADTSASIPWLTGVASVLSASSMSSALDPAVVSLERAHRLAPERADILNDLAVAQLAIAERDQRLVPALRALDAIERVVTRDSSDAVPLFNRALIRERLYLGATARRSWDRFLKVETDEGWRAEAAEHARVMRKDSAAAREAEAWDELLSHGHNPRVAPASAAFPQEAREAAYRKLGEWGDAVGRGDSSTAHSALAAVTDVARGLDSIGGDRSVSLAVEAIGNASMSPARLRALARGHSALARGTEFVFTSDYERAASVLPQARRDLERGASAASGWAAVYEAWGHIGRGDFAKADDLLQRLTRVTREDQPALAGKTRWTLGVTQVRRGNYALAESFDRAAAPFLERAGEAENLAGISFVLTDALILGGRSNAARAEALLGLRRLSRFPRSGYWVNHLTNVASIARTAGLHFAARAVRDEILAAAQLREAPDVMAWTLRDRAEDSWLEGDRAAARRDVVEARRWVDRMGPGVGTDRVRADVDLIAAQLVRAEDPTTAQRLLETAAATYRRLTLWVLLPSALRDLARTSLQLGDTVEARRHLDEAITGIEHQSETFESPDRRASFQETVEGVFDEVVRLELGAGKPVSALAYLERSRVAAWKSGRGTAVARSVGTTPTADLPGRLSEHTLIVDYALLSDRVAIWVASGGARPNAADGWQYVGVPIARDSIARLVKAVRGDGGGAPTDRDRALRSLFESLLGPISKRLRVARRVAIVPDRELFQVPFAALRDPVSGRRLIEDVELAIVPNAEFAVSPAWRGHHMGSAALVVVNAEKAETANGSLPALPGAAEEARRIAPLYRDGVLLTAPGREMLVRALRAPSVLHFAGHAVFDIDQPERSYLLVGSPSGMSALEAREIATMQLSNVQLAVLSACSSLSARATRTGAVAGLAYSFLAAGVPATVSTIWDVSDVSSVDVMVEFHRGLVQGLAPPAALRRAQVDAMKRGKDEQSWSAFIYSGPFTE